MTTTSDDDIIEPLLPHYVYVLMHPDTHAVFYVGEGQGSRVQSHWREVQALVARGAAPGSPKQVLLHDLHMEGRSPLQAIIGRYETKDEALAVAATLINGMYGFDELTNLNRGHGGALIRPRGHMDPIEGIDEARKPGVRTGAYRDRHIAKLSAAGTYDFVVSIEESLSQVGLEWRDLSSREDRPYHPGESHGALGILVRVAGIDFLVVVRATNAPKICVATTATTRAHLDRLARLEAGKPNNQVVDGVRRYMKLPDALATCAPNDAQAVADRLLELRRRLTAD